jgi:hypothetical protein
VGLLEETVWTVVHGLLSDPQRLLRQHKVQLERERRQMRGDPDREVRDIAGQLQKLELERKGYQRLAARGSMGDDELDAALAELDGQRTTSCRRP